MTPGTNENDVIQCEHIEKHRHSVAWQFRVGEGRLLQLCDECSHKIAMSILMDNIERAISEGVRWGMIGKDVK